MPKSNRFLVATEPPTVNPRQFNNSVLRKFERVIVPSTLYPQGTNIVVWAGGKYYPTRNKAGLFPNDGSREGCAMINENKFSLVSGSNYILRSRVIQESIKSGVNITLAGKNWTRGMCWTLAKLGHHFAIALAARRINFSLRDIVAALRFSLLRGEVEKHYVGTVNDSVDFLSRFKVAIVIENEASYVSEKIYAALMAGCQCVYVGPKLNPLDFPEGFLFQSVPTADAVLRTLNKALDSHYTISNETLSTFLLQSKFLMAQSALLRNAWVASSIAGWIRKSEGRIE